MTNMSAAFEKGMNGLLKDHSVALTKELAKVFGFDIKEALQLVDTFLQTDKKDDKKKVVRKEKPVETEEEKKLIEEKADEVMKAMGLSKKGETSEKKKVVRKGKTKAVVDLSPILEQEPLKEDPEEEVFMKDIDGKHYFVNESNGNIHEVASDCEAGEVVGVYKEGMPVFNKDEEAPKKKKSAAKKVEKKEEEKEEKKKGKKVEKKA